MRKKAIGILSALGVGSIGIYMISKPSQSIEKVVSLLIIAILIVGVVNFISIIFKFQGENKRVKIVSAAFNLIMIGVLYFFRLYIATVIPYVFAGYILINSVVRFITGIIYWQDGVPNFGFYFVSSIVTFIFGTYLILNSYFQIISFAILAGVYFIWYSITLLFDAFNDEKTQEKMSLTAKKFQRKVRIALPSLVGAFIPMGLLKRYDHKIESEDANQYIKSQEKMIVEKAGINPYNVEILVHLSNKFMEAFGHVDLIFGEEVVSYGNFDHHTYRLGGALSDGVLFICAKERYLYESIINDGKVLISFKVVFSDQELEIIKENYNKFYKNMYQWYSDTQLAEKGLLETGDYQAVEDIIYKGTGATFYKFKKGPLKTYFALNTNCVKVADSLFENTDFERPATGNIVTPGTYYQFLMGALERQGTKVYEKTIYSKESLEMMT
jgi:uncharacterized membrane protein HdeD (DUF308 family)